MLCAQGNEWLRHYRMARHEFEAESLGNSGDHQAQLEQRKSLADAPTRTIAKWKIRAGGQTILQPIEPALRTKGLRIFEITSVAMHHPLRHHESGIHREIVATNRARRDGGARNGVCSRIQPQNFTDNCPQVREPLEIGNLRRSAAEHAL